ncbi:2,5-dioxovalerate dehydrogenase [Burkholderia latens]|uniref:2,5-dioxovalerate dehydrogenase n=1 Tax=Burkholderia latens TaxID=488446 RepID=A0AAP1CDN1_9BURK|nr:MULTISPECIES: aldehyde dehydrogenase (NADP(+)) [Burkholderia]AOK06481.1 2,5-dioxovalerate dehydrogenase [Burkholderia latens]KVA10642.1 2,5-dioxovalerate dehydrogenase [Burkholderia latens]MCA8310394.1 aldehyde dehydrogenase (NADP(+)) [Burkholderia sp. AU28942]
MTIAGNLLIGQRARRGTNGDIYAIDAASGERMEPAFGGASVADLDEACALAWAAFDTYRETKPEARAAFLDTIASNIVALGDELVERCVAETGLPRARIEGERGRTVGQLRMFADVVRAGDYVEARIDPAQPARQPAPRPDLRLRHIGVGPVAVFGASNFPLAFSVAGGDTASALAAGCPVIVKAHPAHPGTSELVGSAVQQAVNTCGMPEGTFSLLFDSGLEIGQGLVRDPRIKAVGFTGSRHAGTALVAIANARPEPIPVYAEMSSINPVLLFPNALAARGDAIAQQFVQSLTLGAGQFCTNPGLIFAVDGPALERFTAAAAERLAHAPAATMLTPGIHRAFERSVDAFAQHPEVRTVARTHAPTAANQGHGALFSTSADAFRKAKALHEEVFGAASLIVRCPDLNTMLELIESLEGQLTAALHIDEADYAAARAFLPALERRAGRVLVNGFGTGVEVTHAMVHGGPYPSTADGRSTSVGTLAIRRFLRPVCYQDMPDALLPDALKASNPLAINRLLDGKVTLAE